jgi:hypothetical protein
LRSTKDKTESPFKPMDGKGSNRILPRTIRRHANSSATVFSKHMLIAAQPFHFTVIFIINPTKPQYTVLIFFRTTIITGPS